MNILMKNNIRIKICRAKTIQNMKKKIILDKPTIQNINYFLTYYICADTPLGRTFICAHWLLLDRRRVALTLLPDVWPKLAADARKFEI